jgi:hypothetical protein
MRKYKELGDFWLMDNRGHPKQYTDQDRYVKRLELENDVLKKWLEITKKEVYRSNIGLWMNYGESIQSKESARCSEFSRSGFYTYLKRKDEDRDKTIKALILTVYTKNNGIFGYRQIQMHLLQDHGVVMNHKKVLRLMQEMKI